MTSFTPVSIKRHIDASILKKYPKQRLLLEAILRNEGYELVFSHLPENYSGTSVYYYTDKAFEDIYSVHIAIKTRFDTSLDVEVRVDRCVRPTEVEYLEDTELVLPDGSPDDSPF